MPGRGGGDVPAGTHRDSRVPPPEGVTDLKKHTGPGDTEIAEVMSGLVRAGRRLGTAPHHGLPSIPGRKRMRGIRSILTEIVTRCKYYR